MSSSKATVLRIEFMMDHHRDGQTNAARLGVICPGASSAPQFLLARVQLSICFPISLFQLQLLSLSVSSRLLSRNSVQTSGDLSLEQVRLEM